jgi:hypothetical protein
MTWGSVPLLAQTEIITHFAGFGWEEGGFEESAMGDTLILVSHVTSIQGPPGLPYFPDQYEYTLVVTGLSSSGEIDQGAFSTITYNGGTIGIYEDASFNSNWDEIPSEGNPPPSFVDGTLWLSGPFYQFSMVLFRDMGIGSFDGELTLSGGSVIDWFEEDAYIFGGNLIPPHGDPGVPPHYHMSIDGELWANSTATEDLTFSKIKALY